MLTGGQLYDVLCAVVPLYVALFLGYGSLRWWGVVTPEQSAGLSRFNALIAVPPLVFEIIAFNDPYTMNNRLIAAYCLSNTVVLVPLLLWAWFTKRRDGLDWAITLFQLVVMSNTIIVGIPVLTPFYSITGPGIAAIFIGMVLWLYPVLFLYELRAVRLMKLRPPPPPVPADATAHHNAPAPVNDHHSNGIPEAEREDCCVKIGEPEEKKDAVHVSVGSSACAVVNGGLTRETGAREVSELENGHVEAAPATMDTKEMAIRVGKKMACLPLTYTTVLAIIYSLIAGRWDFGPPRLLRNSLDIMGRISLGLTMYTIGSFMAGQKRLLSSWWVAFYGAFCRFVIGPAAMGLASFLLGLRGDTLRFAFLQAALPQAVISFVFARDYNLHTNVFTTAVSLQTIIFMPIVLAYYTLLEL